MVGDRINDGEALGAADVGFSMGVLTSANADVTLKPGNLYGVCRAVEIAARTHTNLKQNLCWAFGYNFVSVLVASGALYPLIGVLVSPVVACTAMMLSSVVILLNVLYFAYKIDAYLTASVEDNTLSSADSSDDLAVGLSSAKSTAASDILRCEPASFPVIAVKVTSFVDEIPCHSVIT